MHSLQQYILLLKKDLQEEFRSPDLLLSMGIYAVLVIVLFGVSLSFAQPGEEYLEISAGLLWAMIVFTSLLGLNRSFNRERELDGFEGILIAPLDRSVIFLAKASSNFIFLLVVEVIAVPLYWFFFTSLAMPADTAILMVLPLLIGSIGVSGVGTLLATITMNTSGKDVLLAVLFVPLLFPLLYACVSATTAVIVGGLVFEESFGISLLLGGAYDFIMILLSWVMYDLVLSV